MKLEDGSLGQSETTQQRRARSTDHHVRAQQCRALMDSSASLPFMPLYQIAVVARVLSATYTCPNRTILCSTVLDGSSSSRACQLSIIVVITVAFQLPTGDHPFSCTGDLLGRPASPQITNPRIQSMSVQTHFHRAKDECTKLSNLRQRARMVVTIDKVS